MEKLKCKCGYDGHQELSLNFDSPDIDRIERGEKILPKFRIKCTCGDCGSYIKFLPFKENLKMLNNKIIDY